MVAYKTQGGLSELMRRHFVGICRPTNLGGVAHDLRHLDEDGALVGLAGTVEGDSELLGQTLGAVELPHELGTQFQHATRAEIETIAGHAAVSSS